MLWYQYRRNVHVTYFTSSINKYWRFDPDFAIHRVYRQFILAILLGTCITRSMTLSVSKIQSVILIIWGSLKSPSLSLVRAVGTRMDLFLLHRMTYVRPEYRLTLFRRDIWTIAKLNPHSIHRHSPDPISLKNKNIFSPVHYSIYTHNTQRYMSLK